MKPRIQIEYEVEENGATVKRSLPFAVGVIGDFIGNASPYGKIPFESREFIPVNLENIASVMAQLKPCIRIEIDSEILPNKSPLTISFESTKDFKPDVIIQKIPALKKLWELRRDLKQLQLQPLSTIERNQAVIERVRRYQEESNHVI